MRRILILILLISSTAHAEWYTNDGMLQLPGPVRIFEDIYKWYKGVDTKIVTESKDAVTYYVETTGSDNNNCTTLATACATIQSVINRLPTIISQTITINIGQGDFAGLNITNRMIKDNGILTIQGTLGNPALAGGTVSGTATAGDTFTCTDGGQAWVANALRGMLVKVGTEYRVVRTNDGTTLNLVGPLAATCNGKAYELFEQKTVFNAYGTGWPTNAARIQHIGNLGWGRDRFRYYNIKTTGGLYGGYFAYGSGAEISRCQFNGSTYSTMFMQSTTGEFKLTDDYFVDSANSVGLLIVAHANRMYDGGTNVKRLYAYSNADEGIEFDQVPSITMDYVYTDANTSRGILFHNVYYASINGINADSNTGGGLAVYSGGTIELGYEHACTISNNGSHGINATWNAQHVILNYVSGTNNTGYGVYVTLGHVENSSNTNITGTLGDATINIGNTIITWATHLATAGDTVVNVDNGSSIIRY